MQNFVEFLSVLQCLYGTYESLYVRADGFFPEPATSPPNAVTEGPIMIQNMIVETSHAKNWKTTP